MGFLQRSLRSIKPIYTIAYILSQVPPYERRNKYNIRSVIITIATISFYLYVTATFDIKSLSMTTAVILAMNLLCCTLFQVFITSQASIFKAENWNRLIELMTEIEYFLNIENQSRILIYFELILGHLYYFIIMYNVYVTSDLPLQYVLLMNALVYYIYISATLNYNFALCLNRQYVEFNRILERDLREDLCKLHMKIIEASLQFNENVGWSFFFLVVTIVFTTLQAFNFIIIAASKNILAEEYDNITVEFLLAIMFLVFGIAVIYSCDLVADSSSRTAIICYQLLNRKQYVNLHSDLVKLSQQSKLFGYFTAAGFFDMDVSLLLSIFGVVASNLIIIIQLN